MHKTGLQVQVMLALLLKGLGEGFRFFAPYQCVLVGLALGR